MRVAIVAALLLGIVVTAAPALAAPSESSADERVNVFLRRGLQLLSAARQETASSRKLSLLDQGLYTLHRARGLRRIQGDASRYAALDRAVERALIHTLNEKTRVYLGRGSLPQAVRANRAALAYSLADTEALNLRAAIAEVLSVDIFEEMEGQPAIDRLRERREEAGTPVRDRGVARRR